MLVSEFLSLLKVRARIQSNETVLSNQELIDLANSELRFVLCPKILSVREDYFAGIIDYQIGTSRRFRLPPRILGNRVLRVLVISNGEPYRIPQVAPDLTLRPIVGFYMTEGDLVLTGDQVPTGTLRVIYPVRPPKMAPSAASLATISSVAGGTITISPSVPLSTREIIRSGSPYRTISPSVAVNLTSASDNDCQTEQDRYAVGDIVIAQDSTHIVPLEDELCDWLIQRTAMRVFELLGHRSEMELAAAKLSDMERDCLALISPRVSDEPKVVNGMESLGWRDT